MELSGIYFTATQQLSLFLKTLGWTGVDNVTRNVRCSRWDTYYLSSSHHYLNGEYSHNNVDSIVTLFINI